MSGPLDDFLGRVVSDCVNGSSGAAITAAALVLLFLALYQYWGK